MKGQEANVRFLKQKTKCGKCYMSYCYLSKVVIHKSFNLVKSTCTDIKHFIFPFYIKCK